MKLFAFYVGGSMPRANTELHDIFFSVGPSMKDCEEDLRRQWWGTPDSLHIDCWGVLDHADGYDIDLKREPYTGNEKLFFVNLGGYDLKEFTELHKNVFVVASGVNEAKKRALAMTSGWVQGHRDYFYEVENMLQLDKMGLDQDWHVHLAKSATPKEFKFTCRYIVLGKRQKRTHPIP